MRQKKFCVREILHPPICTPESLAGSASERETSVDVNDVSNNANAHLYEDSIQKAMQNISDQEIDREDSEITSTLGFSDSDVSKELR